MQNEPEVRTKDYLFVSDFDQTLSFNDSGIALGELIGASDFGEKFAASPASTWSRITTAIMTTTSLKC